MPDFIITAERTVTMDQRAVVAMDLKSAADAPHAAQLPEDAWTQVAIRQATGAHVVSVLEYDDPRGRLEFVTGAVRVPGPDFVVDTQGNAQDTRGAN